MAQLTITIPDAQVQRVLAAFAARIGVENPTAEDIRGEIINLVKIIVRTHEEEAAKAAIVVTDVDAS